MTALILELCLLAAVFVVFIALLCNWAGRTAAQQIEAAMRRSYLPDEDGAD